jgi:Subtilase family/Secretion system C-terminal sorting domain
MAIILPLKLLYSIFRLTNRLLVVCLSVACLYAEAQTSNSVLNISRKLDGQFINRLQQRYTANRQQALRLAKKKGWFVSKKYANGRILTLQGVDSLGVPIYYTTHNVVASTGTHTTGLYNGGGLGIDLKGDLPALDGRFCIWDGGMPRLSHIEFGGRIRQKDQNTTLNDHSTHLSGTMAATGVNPQVKGMAFGAKLDVWDYTDDLTEMAAEASKMLVSNHAYGPVVGWVFNQSRPGNDPKLKWEWWGNTSISTTEDYRFGFYDEKAQDLDKLAFNSPFYLIVKSADNKHAETGPPIGVPYFLRNTNQISILDRNRNDAYDVIPAEANAKNILTIGGAIVNIKEGNISDFSVADFSGWGPTDDGRIKPDLLGVGTNIISSISSSNNAYATMSGTSTACANVSGTLILLQELFYRRQAYFMRSATLKGLVLHTANKPNGKVGPSYAYGWGLLNAEKAAKVLLNIDNKHVLLESALRQNENYQQKIIAAGNEPLMITICWTDPEGLATRAISQNVDNNTPKLINDLDVRLTDDSGNTWFPWVLDPANPSNAAVTGDNIRDNVEQVFIATPTAGKVYTVSVRHKRTLQNNNQPFSLFISGVRPQDCNAAVQILKGKDTTLCSNEKLQIQVKGDNALTYQWLKDGKLISTTTTPTLEISQAGQYVVKANGYQCSAESKPISVAVTNLTAQISPEGSSTICSGTPIKLSANTGVGYKYQWLREGENIAGATSSVLNPTEAGNYSVAISFNNCTAISKPTQLLSALQQPVISTNSGTIIPLNGSIRLTTNTGEGITYRWFINGEVIPTATGPRFTATFAGKYRVEITQNGCSITSKTLELINVKYPTNSPIKTTPPEVLIIEEHLQLYPNPVESVLTVAYESDNTYNLDARIVTLNGVTLSGKLLYDNGNVFLNQFDVSKLPAGKYFIHVSDGRRAIAKPFIKQ